MVPFVRQGGSGKERNLNLIVRGIGLFLLKSGKDPTRAARVASAPSPAWPAAGVPGPLLTSADGLALPAIAVTVTAAAPGSCSSQLLTVRAPEPGAGRPLSGILCFREGSPWGSCVPEEPSGQKGRVKEQRGKGRTHLFSIGVVDRRHNPTNHNKPSSFVQIIPGSF